MDQLYRLLKPWANKYTIILSWSLSVLNVYLFFKPLREYATSAGLSTLPKVLDEINYYTPDEGYEALMNLGSRGRHAYRLANYTDFVLPILLFFSLTLPNLALGKGSRYVVGPFIYMFVDYLENIAEKYVLEIYPERNDPIMTFACYTVVVAMNSASNTVLLDLLLKATRTSDVQEAIRWWNHFYETLHAYRTNREQSSAIERRFFLTNRRSSTFSKTIQALAEVLDKDNLSVIHYVAYHNNFEICQRLADENCDFNTMGKDGETILHIAARSKEINGDTERDQFHSLLFYLLSTLTIKKKALVNIDQRDDHGRSALHHAIMSNRIANTKLLLDYQACIAARDICQATPLHYACRYNQSNTIVRYLLAQAESLAFQSDRFQWMGRSASHKECFPIRSKLDYINAKSRDGHDAFSLARMYEHDEILDELFKHIPSDDVHWQERHRMVSNRICKAIHVDDYLTLDSYPSWFIINENTGETILHLACTLGCSTTVQYLLERQRKDHHQGPNAIFLREKQHGFTPLLSAVYIGQVKCFECMLDYTLEAMSIKPDLLVDRYGRTLLHLAILSREATILDTFFLTIHSESSLFVKLIEPMLYALDYNDETPLHLAVRLKLYSFCQFLLQFADKLDDIQQPYIYIDKIDGELIRSTHTDTNTIRVIPTEMSSMLTKSRVYAIACKNKTGQSAFHTAVLQGDLYLMNLFLQYVNEFGKRYLLEQTDGQIRTALHLACLKGYIEIVKKLFSLNVNVYARDMEESTPLHCVARCVHMRYINGNDASACILDIFLQYIQNCKQMSFDLLTAIDGFGHNCLETAILARNRSFVSYLLYLNNIPLFKNLLRNAQILDVHYRHVDTPLRKLITCMPDLAYQVLSICITHIGDKHRAQSKMIYDFEFLEDYCSIQHWQHNRTLSVPADDDHTHTCYCPIFCHHKPLQFQSKYRHNNLHQPLIAYTTDPYVLIHNNVLSMMCKCAKKIDLKDHEDNYEHIQHSYRLMHHPLCRQLTQLKWQQFGLPLFLTSFIIYCVYLILFTVIMLRNKQPEYFYRLVNASFPHGYHLNGTTRMECAEVAKYLVKLNVHEAMKHPTDRILKNIVLILLWIHVCKDALLIIGVHRCSLVWRLYLETISFILSFICLYDDNRWQRKLKFRCPKQWQVGAFGVFLAWATLLSYLRFLPIFGVYVVMLEVIMLKFLWFAPVLVILICSFSSAFYMLLQNQPVFSTIPFAWFRSVFMMLDTGYEDRFFGPDSDSYISLYPVLFVLFLLFGVTMTILVNNLLTALAVGEIADLSAIARVRNATRRYELLREWEIFRLQCLPASATLHLYHEHIEKQWDRRVQRFLKWIYRHTFLKSND
ncbi:unnamed protein product [Adineta ricciae]|uniref:Transient receptor potential cation channel subfamily A member 1 n=1 Tax=Adineta ricciae TaxID=249248 RepID=A0A814Y7Z7_ADIRI|nr:unnamed protein product [Adineta ricciae]